MRKLILGFLVLLLPLAAACERSSQVLDRIPAGSQLTVTTHGGRSISGRLSETRGDALVIQPAVGSPTTVPRNDIATVTIATVEPRATGRAAKSASGSETPNNGAASRDAAAHPSEPARASGAAEEPAPHAEGSAPARPESAEPEKWREVTLPAGTVLPIRLEESLASDRSRVEEPVTATVVSNVAVHGLTAVPVGSVVSGAVTEARRSGKVKGVAQLAVRFDAVAPKGSESRYHVRTGLVSRRAPTTRRKDALKIGAPAAGGLLVGGLLGGKKGALIGGTIAGGAGTAVVLTTRGQEVRLPRGTRLAIRLLEPVTVRVRA